MRENRPVPEKIFKACKGAERWTRVEMRDIPTGFINSEYRSAIEFCQNDLVGNHFKLLRDFWFEDPAEAVLFKLRYG
ncbi:hypothetical protein D3C87_1030960 [compost metagenome]